MEKEIKHKNFTNFLAYAAIIAVALSVLVAYILNKVNIQNGNIVTILNSISIILSSIVCALSAFYYVKRKGNIWITISYIVAVIVVLLFVVLP